MPRFTARKKPGDRARHADGYVLVYAPDHPRAQHGYVFEHHAVAEKAIGKTLPLGAVVHHVNENPTDNRPVNLVICQDQAYHLLLHGRTRVLRDQQLGGKVCIRCEDRRPFSEFVRDRSRFDGLSPLCRACAALRKRG